MKILAFQAEIEPSTTRAQKETNVKNIISRLNAKLESVSASIPDLVVLPELTTIDYSRDAFEKLGELAEEIDGFTFTCFSQIAKKHGIYISFSIPQRAAEKFFITNNVVDDSGQLVSYYDKLHLAQFGDSIEKEYFERGNSISTFNLNEFTIGIVLCYDFRFPEYISHLVNEHGVNLIIHPVAFSTDETFASWHHFVITRAIENQIYFLSLNRAGDSWGKSIFCPPWIDDNLKPEIMAKIEDARIFDLSLDEVIKSREKYTFSLDKLSTYKNLKKT